MSHFLWPSLKHCGLPTRNVPLIAHQVTPCHIVSSKNTISHYSQSTHRAWHSTAERHPSRSSAGRWPTWHRAEAPRNSAALRPSPVSTRCTASCHWEVPLLS
ncbi:hypothetical protein MAPG_04174 [Magnaporthiopsis poae ATCC 64411]|uniref:Uncharacterized protein n=1 Tax=Magnaporthiopsis poae (strain ATCC 64411 / 73-15) TaxID=644358 RepID=A0A0C4DW07_MAGP6|nr:hypothetical protein MAPG_04174 [Magnaporthiopsis poae ATCC 64411]